MKMNCAGNNSRSPQFNKKPKLTLNLWLVALCQKITHDRHNAL